MKTSANLLYSHLWFFLYGILLGPTVLFAQGTFRPNIILIYTDDQGYGDSSYLNPESKFQTPNLDRLAKEGVSFTNAHSSDTVCTPSRYGLLTGRYSWRTSLKWGVFGAERKCLIEDGRITLASLLKDHGYATAMVGKWHLGMDFPGDKGSRDWTKPVEDMPLDKGFHYFYGIPASMNFGVLAWFEGRFAKVPPALYTAKKPNDMAIADYRIMPPYEVDPQEVEEKLGARGMEVAPDFVDSECLSRFTTKAIEWIQKQVTEAKRGRPFFLYIPYTSPHKPVVPLPEFRGRGQAGAYADFMIETDHHVGQILDFLSSLGLERDTMIIFTSDNGPENTWKQRIELYDHDSSGIYRDGKRSIYEGGHRVPFFIRWPAGIRSSGRTCDRLVGQIDLLATLAEMIGAELPANAGEDSQSFFSVLRDPLTEHKRLPLINHSARGRFSITEGKWKLIMPHENSSRELYNLHTDPGEENNLFHQHLEIAVELERKITQIVGLGRTAPGSPQPNDTGYWEDLTWLDRGEYESLQPLAEKGDSRGIENPAGVPPAF